MPIDLTLVEEVNGLEGIADLIHHLKLPDDAEIEIDGEVMTVRDFKILYAEYEADRDAENDRDISF